jgi:hypothetical protein
MRRTLNLTFVRPSSILRSRSAIHGVTVALFLIFWCWLPSIAQQAGPDSAAAQQAKKTLQDAASAGAPIPTTANVDSSVNIEAVMLPRSVVRRVFGSEVSRKYAVIEVNISNRNNAAGFILQSLFIDYSHWALAQPLNFGGITRDGKPYQSRASTREVSSVEYRIVRGQVLDQQPWTTRNIALRSIQVLGSIGTSFAFPFSRDVVTGIGAWNGAVVPGFQVLFPDGLEGQLNRISDYGFRNDKIIPQQSADIVVAFFPIERFLSPSLQQIFLESPALFFNPYLMAIDPKTQKQLRPILKNALGSDAKVDSELSSLATAFAGLDVENISEIKDQLQQRQEAFNRDSSLQTDLLSKLGKAGLNANETKTLQDTLNQLTIKITQDSTELGQTRKDFNDAYGKLKTNPLFNFLSQVSLSNVNVVVSGIMTVDQQTIPATIESTCFDKAGPDLWAVAGKKSCFIKGRFLTDGIPKILGVDPADPGITNIVVDKDNSTSELLKFSFDLKEPLDSATVDIVVTKSGKDGTSVDSMKYRQSSSYVLPGPLVQTVTTDASGVATVLGSGFYSNSSNKFSLSLRTPGADKKNDKQILSAAPSDPTKIVLDAATLSKVPSGCYQVVAMVGTKEGDSPTDQLIRVDPTITGAKRDGTKIVVTGSDFASIKACATGLTIEFVDSADKVLGTPRKFNDGALNENNLTFDLGADAANAAKVRLTGRTPEQTIN